MHINLNACTGSQFPKLSLPHFDLMTQVQIVNMGMDMDIDYMAALIACWISKSTSLFVTVPLFYYLLLE